MTGFSELTGRTALAGFSFLTPIQRVSFADRPRVTQSSFPLHE
jgi:hypothetical protein